MAYLTALLLLLSTLGSNAQEEPCQSYTILSDVYRSTAYVMDFMETGLCDMDKAAGWYRFNSSAGTTMPESCVHLYHCGTVVPIWMNGAHPTVADGIVTRQACANLGTSGNCCDRYLNIRVKNCGQYFVYYLYPAPSCPIAYCAGNLQPCPMGQWSETGLEPGCRDAYPMMTTKPTLQGPFVTATSFSFHCVLDFPDQDPTQEFEVAWTFSGEEDASISHQTLRDPHRTAILEGSLLKGHIGKDVGCKVRSSYQGGPAGSSPWAYSNVYRAEIKVEPGQITVGEDGKDQTITLTSTIPVVCDGTVGAASCVVSIPLDTNGVKDNLVFNSPCIYQLKSTDWDDQNKTVSASITVAAAKDKINDGNKNMILTFREILELVGGPYKTIFSGYQIPPVQVVAEDAPSATCKLTGDPHITDFRGLYFHLYDVGVYTLYRYEGPTPGDLFELQAHTFPCNVKASCICGLAIRERGDVIRLAGCNNLGATMTLELPTAPLREGTVIQRSTDGRTTVVYLPSGREVKADTVYYTRYRVNYSNVYLAVLATDRQGTGGGICGTLDARVPNDHYVRGDGTWEKACGQGCIPRSFADSWRVDIANSWFQMIPNDNGADEDNRYCQCDNAQGDKRLNCTVAADIFHREEMCGGTCEEVKNPDEGVWQPGRRAIGIDMDESDPPLDLHAHVTRDEDVGWPTESGITETQAREECLQETMKSQLWSNCQHMSSLLDLILEDCIADILYTDSYDMVESALASFTSQCQSELSLDPSNYVTTPEGHSVMLPELTHDVCSTFCLRHGHCVRGTCVCDTGYVGDNCQLDGTKGPQLLNIRGSKYCDTNERPCRKIYFDAENFQSGEGFICKSQEFLENGQLSTEVHFEEAIFVNDMRLACLIPDSRTKTDKWIKTFSVSATFDGNQYGNALNVAVYDSTCQTCDNGTGCVRKPNTCLINDLCYRDGDYKPGDATQRCVTSHSEDTWSTVSVCTGEVMEDEWTVFQRRVDGSQDFYLGWDQYVTGFGRNDSNYWMGLEPLHQLTSSGSYELRVDLKDWNDVMASASYSNFFISNAYSRYSLEYDQFLGGDAGDSLSMHRHMPFSTKDADYDLAFTGSCADWYHGGWWYNACLEANLNGKYYSNNRVLNAPDGLHWNSFRGSRYSVKCSEMRVRPTPSGTDAPWFPAFPDLG